MGKKIAVSFSIILICTFTFINGYTCVYPSFADSTTDQWTSVTTNQELADAFRYYCKSRNLAIEGSVADAVTSFTTNSFNNICNNLGIDVTALQAHLKRSTDSNGRLQFLFDQTGVTAYNRIFAELLQNNDLEVGDTADETNNTVYSGYWITDADGNKCLVYIVSGLSVTQNSNRIEAYGTKYKYDGYEIKNLYDNGTRSVVFNVTNNISITRSISKTNLSLSYGGNRQQYNMTNVIYDIGYANSNFGYTDYANSMGHSCIALVNNTTNLYLCVYFHNHTYMKTGNNISNEQDYETISSLESINFNSVDKEQTVIYYTTNNNTINNNTYNDNRQTVINNEGDVYNYDYDDEDPPINNPSGGGGGGTVTPPSDSGGPDGDISFPDFNFQLPEINWSLGDLSEKFPFSIPFDLIAFFTVLNAQPQAPSIDANIPLGSWYTWHFHADFSQFNNWASIIRNVEFIAFCIGLIYLTIRLVKG